MAKKTYNEKLHSPADLPKIEDLSDKPEAVKRYHGAELLIAAPTQYNDLMAKVPEGKVLTIDKSGSTWPPRPVRILPAR